MAEYSKNDIEYLAAKKYYEGTATVDTMATQLGSVTETAPANDTASSGLNGRLQRIAQRLTSLIALLPTALGQALKAACLPVVTPVPLQTSSYATLSALGTYTSLTGTAPYRSFAVAVGYTAFAAGDTVVFEASYDGGTWVPVGLRSNAGTYVTSTTAAGVFVADQYLMKGISRIRVRKSVHVGTTDCYWAYTSEQG